MSEETNDMIEETNDLSEETSHNNSHHVSMESDEFEAKLTEFFTKHKKSKLRLVSKIAFEFKGQENLVFEHLNNKYVLGMDAKKSKGNAVHKLEGNTDSHQQIKSSPIEKPKSKKKLVIIIIVVVAIVGLVIGGFMMKDKIMGTGKGHETEKEAPKAKAPAESKAKVKKSKEALTPQQVDSILESKSAPKKDSIKK